MFLSKAWVNLKQSIGEMRFADHFIYWMLPLVMSIAFVCCYYAGSAEMQEIIAPAKNRELGLLENTAHLILLMIILVLGSLMIKKQQLLLRLVFIIMFLWFAFVFLEEIDYGLHWIETIKNTSENEKATVRNFHNRGDGTLDVIKAFGHILIALVFVVIPTFFGFLSDRKYWFVILMPSPRMIFPAAVIVITGWMSEFMEGLNYINNDSLAGNRAEFDELTIYYSFLVYFLEVRERFNR